MRLSSLQIQNFKKFHDFTVCDIPDSSRLVLLTGPNGSGKSSVFEAFHFWSGALNDQSQPDSDYHSRTKERDVYPIWENIRLNFHGDHTPVTLNSRHVDHDRKQKLFYVRSAYRHEPDFSSEGLQKRHDILQNTNRPAKLIQTEARVSENYQRLVADSLAALYDPKKRSATAEEITERLLGNLRRSMQNVFDDLVLDGPGNPLVDGTFRFTKGKSSGFHYKNLSSGEKAAFDLLLDFIIKREAFDDTIHCIDEAELHMHTRLQGRLMRELFKLVPEKCQLWLSTHSIGMARTATALDDENPGQVAFIDFHNINFDEPVRIKPNKPNRAFWKNMFSTALEDLSELIAPRYIIFCEGKRLGGLSRKPSFDVTVYKTIFGDSYPEVEFIPLGGVNELEMASIELKAIIERIARGIRTWSVMDRDDRSTTEISELKSKGIAVLPRRDLENYLWDEEVIRMLCDSVGRSEVAQEIIDEKKRLIEANGASNKPSDEIKEIRGLLYNCCKQKLRLTGCGNNAESFEIVTLAPLIRVGSSTYEELEDAIFSSIKLEKS